MLIIVKYYVVADELFLTLQVSLVIRGRYVPSFWTANPEFAVKKSIFRLVNCHFFTNFVKVNSKRIRRSRVRE